MNAITGHGVIITSITAIQIIVRNSKALLNTLIHLFCMNFTAQYSVTCLFLFFFVHNKGITNSDMNIIMLMDQPGIIYIPA